MSDDQRPEPPGKDDRGAPWDFELTLVRRPPGSRTGTALVSDAHLAVRVPGWVLRTAADDEFTTRGRLAGSHVAVAVDQSGGYAVAGDGLAENLLLAIAAGTDCVIFLPDRSALPDVRREVLWLIGAVTGTRVHEAVFSPAPVGWMSWSAADGAEATRLLLEPAARPFSVDASIAVSAHCVESPLKELIGSIAWSIGRGRVMLVLSRGRPWRDLLTEADLIIGLARKSASATERAAPGTGLPASTPNGPGWQFPRAQVVQVADWPEAKIKTMAGWHLLQLLHSAHPKPVPLKRIHAVLKRHGFGKRSSQDLAALVKDWAREARQWTVDEIEVRVTEVVRGGADGYRLHPEDLAQYRPARDP